jgi:hypothetical protein
MTPASDQRPLVVFESTGTPAPLFIELAPIFVRLELESTKEPGRVYGDKEATRGISEKR